MKKLISLLLVLLFALSTFTACASSASAPLPAGEPASQEDFLSDMAKGIKDRLKLSGKDETNMTDDEFCEHRRKLVKCELDQIEKYDLSIFADKKFDQLAHAYIEACQTQYHALDYYKNNALYNAMFNGGREIRAGIIVYLYEVYDLPITSEEADRYRPTETVVSYSLDIPGLTDQAEEKEEKVDPIHITHKNPNPVIYNKDGIKVTVNACKRLTNQCYVEFFLDNSSKDIDDLHPMFHDTYVNDFNMGGGGGSGGSADAGKKSYYNSYLFYYEELEKAGISSFTQIETVCNIWTSAGIIAEIPLIIDADVFVWD